MAESLLAVLWVADLPLQALWRASPERREQPLVVVKSQSLGGGARILLTSAAARAQGILPGMTVAQARARCPGLLAQRRDPLLESSAREALSGVARAFSPRVELGEDETHAWAYCDAAGLTQLHGTPVALAHAMERALRPVGLCGQVALARTKLLARLAVQVGLEPPVVPEEPAAEQRFLAELPLAALEPTPGLLAMLARFGLRRVADLLALPAGEVISRLGPEGAQLLAQARGEESGAGLQPTPQPAHPAERQSLDYAIDNLEPLLFLLRGLLDRLVRRLALGGHFAGPLHLTLDYEEGGQYHTQINTGAPTRDVQALTALVRLRLCETPPARAVTALEVSAEPRSGRIQQLDLFAPAGPAADKLALTLTRLAALCGPERIGVPVPLDTYQEDAFTMGSFTVAASAVQSAPNRTASALRRLRPPVSIDVLREGSRLVCLESLTFRSRIAATRGPFRFDEGWWRTSATASAGGDFDLYDIELADGRTARVAELRPAQRWLLLGWYD